MQFGVSSRGMQKVFPQCECEYVAVDPPCPWHGNHNSCIHGVPRLPSPAIAEPTGTEPGSLGIQLLFTFFFYVGTMKKQISSFQYSLSSLA